VGPLFTGLFGLFYATLFYCFEGFLFFIFSVLQEPDRVSPPCPLSYAVFAFSQCFLSPFFAQYLRPFFSSSCDTDGTADCFFICFTRVFPFLTPFERNFASLARRFFLLVLFPLYQSPESCSPPLTMSGALASHCAIPT